MKKLLIMALAENTSNGPKGQEEGYTRWAATRGAEQFGISKQKAFKITRQNAANRRGRAANRDNFVKRITG